VFYQTLFSKKYNVCSAFETAKKEVKETISESEASKFLLKTQESETHSNKKHV
jgi:hypothetical protein